MTETGVLTASKCRAQNLFSGPNGLISGTFMLEWMTAHLLRIGLNLIFRAPCVRLDHVVRGHHDGRSGTIPPSGWRRRECRIIAV